MNGDPLPRPAARPPAPDDAGSQALAEALRSSFGIVKLLMALLVVVFFVRGFFTVGPQERAVILRFGKPLGEGEKALRGPGLHWTLPYPIEEYIKIPVTEQQKARSTVGWFAPPPGGELLDSKPESRGILDPRADGYVLTADANIIHLRATLSYRIQDPIGFYFGFGNAAATVTNALDNALVHSAARFKVDDILTRDVEAFRETVSKRASELLEQAGVGIRVEQCFVERSAPGFLLEAFNRVGQAEAARSKQLNDARKTEGELLSWAATEATNRVNAARAASARLVESLQSEATNFVKLLPEFNRYPDLFLQQRLSATMIRAMTNVQDVILLSERADGQPRELRLLLNREPQRPRTGVPAQ